MHRLIRYKIDKVKEESSTLDLHSFTFGHFESDFVLCYPSHQALS